MINTCVSKYESVCKMALLNFLPRISYRRNFLNYLINYFVVCPLISFFLSADLLRTNYILFRF